MAIIQISYKCYESLSNHLLLHYNIYNSYIKFNAESTIVSQTQKITWKTKTMHLPSSVIGVIVLLWWFSRSYGPTKNVSFIGKPTKIYHTDRHILQKLIGSFQNKCFISIFSLEHFQLTRMTNYYIIIPPTHRPTSIPWTDNAEWRLVNVTLNTGDWSERIETFTQHHLNWWSTFNVLRFYRIESLDIQVWQRFSVVYI